MRGEATTRERTRKRGYRLTPNQLAILEQGFAERGFLTQRKAAKEIGLHPSTLSAILRGQSWPNGETLGKLGSFWSAHEPQEGISQLLHDLQAAS